MFDKKLILSKLSKKFDTAVAAYGVENQNVFNNSRKWPSGFGTTRRRNKEIVVGSNRNIVDLGLLRDSQRIKKLNDDQYRLSWNTPYGSFVYFGFVTKSGRVIPGRPWAKVAVELTDWQAIFRS